jgi:LPXTG-motif cell wall-anchored protein
MTGRTVKRRAAVAVALAALVGGAIATVAAVPASASASTVPLTISLGVVMPGASATASHAFVIDRDSVVASAAWVPAAGSATTWNVEVCGAAGCRAVDDLAGAHLAAGDYRLDVTVVMPQDAVDGTTLSGTGRISLAESHGTLAVTGGSSPWIAAVAGAGICALGALLLVRRRRTDEGVAR